MEPKMKPEEVQALADDLFFLDLMEAFHRAAMTYPVDELPRDVESNLMRLTLEKLDEIASERAETVSRRLGMKLE